MIRGAVSACASQACAPRSSAAARRAQRSAEEFRWQVLGSRFRAGTSSTSVSTGNESGRQQMLRPLRDEDTVNVQPGTQRPLPADLGLRCRPGHGRRELDGCSARRSSFKRLFCLLCTMRRGMCNESSGSPSRFYAVHARCRARYRCDSTCTMAGAVIVSVFVASAIREPR